jgi:hypothetical protein
MACCGWPESLPHDIESPLLICYMVPDHTVTANWMRVVDSRDTLTSHASHFTALPELAGSASPTSSIFGQARAAGIRFS